MFLALDFPPQGGGIARHLHEIVRHLPPATAKVIGLPAPGWSEFDHHQEFEVERISLPFGWRYYREQLKLLAPFYLKHLLTEDGFQYVVCGQAHHSIMLAAWLYSIIKGIPYVVLVYGLDLLEPQTRIYRRPFNYLLRAAQIVVADSRAAADITRTLGVKRDKLHVINPGINTSPPKSTMMQEDVRTEHGLGDKRCILTVGRLVERKGHDVVLQSLPMVLREVPDVHYLIVGSGSNLSRLRRLVVELGMTQHVTFVGRVSDDALPAYYAMCDVFVMVSREIPERGDMEGFGIVFLEANLYGKPVVAGKSGGVSDAVVHEETGLLVDPNDPEVVAAAITRLLSDQELSARLGRIGRQRVITQFDSRSTARQLQLILSSRS